MDVVGCVNRFGPADDDCLGGDVTHDKSLLPEPLFCETGYHVAGKNE